VSYFAAALARSPAGWRAQEVDLDGVADVDEVADLLRDVDERASTTLLFVEEDDEYVAIVRVDSGVVEPRVFISDARAADSYPIVEMLADAVATDDPNGDEIDDEDDDDDTPPGHDSEPLGDAALLDDFGTPPRELLALCAHEGTLPADVVTEVCERAGCLDQLESLRLGG
jgi:putative tRNA adenosine deaminase-associated protein